MAPLPNVITSSWGSSLTHGLVSVLVLTRQPLSLSKCSLTDVRTSEQLSLHCQVSAQGLDVCICHKSQVKHFLFAKAWLKS